MTKRRARGGSIRNKARVSWDYSRAVALRATVSVQTGHFRVEVRIYHVCGMKTELGYSTTESLLQFSNADPFVILCSPKPTGSAWGASRLLGQERTVRDQSSRRGKCFNAVCLPRDLFLDTTPEPSVSTARHLDSPYGMSVGVSLAEKVCITRTMASIRHTMPDSLHLAPP